MCHPRSTKHAIFSRLPWPESHSSHSEVPGPVHRRSIALIEEAPVVERILRHLRPPTEVSTPRPGLAPLFAQGSFNSDADLRMGSADDIQARAGHGPDGSG
jgi:hypothetical protein